MSHPSVARVPPPSNDENKLNMIDKPFVLKPVRYVIVPISFVNSGKQTITHALKSILPNVVVVNGHSVSNERFYKSLSRVLDNDKVQVVIAHRNNTGAGDRHKIYEALRGHRDKYELKFIAVQFVQKEELFSDSFMNRLLNDIIINEEMTKEDLSLIARGPGKIREIVNATRSRFQDITQSEKRYYPLIINLRYKDDKFFEYLKTILQSIHEMFPVLLPSVLPDEDIAKYTYEADTKEEANARDFYSNGAANLKKYELDPEGEFGDSPNTRSSSLNQIRELQSLPVLPSPQLKQQGKPTKFVIIQCSTLGTGKEQITQILMENLLVKPALIESGNQTALFKDLSRAFIRHSTVVISANNHRYFHRNMIVSVLKRFHINYNVHTICLDYINDLDYDTFDFFQRSTNNILSLEFRQPSAAAKHLKTLTITDTEAFMIPKLLREFDRVEPPEQSNYETYIPLKFDHHRLFEYLIQIHTQLSHKYGNDQLLKSQLLKPDHIFTLTEKFDSNEIVCWRYYHESIGYNEKSFKPDISIPYVPYVPQMPQMPHVSPYIPSQLSPPVNSKSDRKARQKAMARELALRSNASTPLLTGTTTSTAAAYQSTNRNTTNGVTAVTHPLSKKIAIAGTCTLLLVVLVLSLHSRYAMLLY